MALDFHDMREMQEALQARYAGWWEPVDPEHGKNKILWMLAELGEAIQVVKRKRPVDLMQQADTRRSDATGNKHLEGGGHQAQK